jgi:peptide/nickel transport system substrate-binding protein
MKKWLFPVMVVIIIGAMLSACSPATPAAKPQAPSAPAPDKNGGIVKTIMGRAPVIFGYPPRLAGPDLNYANPFFDRLVNIENGGAIKPCLATSWEIAPDGNSITLKLRQGVKFHDGTDFNAKAAKSNLDALIPPNPAVLSGVASVDAVDDYTIKVNLPGYNNLVLYQMGADVRCAMYSPTALQKNGADWANTNPVGTGPFMLKSYERNTKLTYVKNPDYWEKGLPYLDGMEVIPVTDPMTQMVSFKAGEVNQIFDASNTMAAQLRDQGYPLIAAPGTFWALSFDNKNPDSIFANPKVREAIEYAIDKDAMAQGPGLGIYKSVYQLAVEGSTSYNPACPPRKYDPAKAKQLLAEAGYADGFKFKISCQDTTWRDGVTAVQSYLAKVGITLDVNYVNAAAINVIRAEGKIDKSSSAQLQVEVFSNGLFTLDRYLREDSPVYQYVQRPKGVNDLFNQARAARDMGERDKITQQIVKAFYDDKTIIPVWLNQRIVVTDKVVQDLGWFYDNDSNVSRFGRSTWLKK